MFGSTQSKWCCALFAVAIVITARSTAVVAQGADASPELVARMEKEKDARRACKIEICKAFATPGEGAPIRCAVTKTWTRSEIVSRVVGGDYVWGYGHMQCSMQLDLDRAQLGKAAREAATKITMPEHKITCNVDDKDASKGQAFSVAVALTPSAMFEKGSAKKVTLDPVKTEGSAIASAAVTSLMAVDAVSGVASRAISAEIDSFFYEKCAADGVEIVRK